MSSKIDTGFGRCGTRFFGSRPGLTPDLLVVGKALGNGLPISAVLGDPALLDALPSGAHSSTFAGHPLACAAGAEVVDAMLETRPWRLAREAGSTLRDSLAALAATVPGVGPPRGEGLLVAFDCLDGSGRPSAAAARAFAAAALRAGVVLRHGGWSGSTVKLSPPLLLEDGEVSFLTEALRAAAERATPAREEAHALL
ncbi:MAG TPA: aminotransferase class III-fold pyridoxal phosphate-dependent enzyme [Longimicrobiaceae bacterium]|nr:aminotransferase class III-fold pyridoxal phosphate-dependent enzyme [Longimicrobiaceae bacterium]